MEQHIWDTTGFYAKRHLPDIQQINQACAIGEDASQQANQPVETKGQRASVLWFLDVCSQVSLPLLVVLGKITSHLR